ncbi:MAG: TlpA family protein disulfide reductase, partial [Lachnospiraceae bacterium]|nr:TlpA family protein disulfide reductase [Lachnospiraceae bacterium]
DTGNESTDTQTDETEDAQVEAAYGYHAGDRLGDFSIKCIDESSFNLSDAKGKTVIIALFGTYSEDSLSQLDMLESVLKDHEDTELIAVCNHFSAGNPAEIAKERGWTFPVALDGSDEKVFKLTGASIAVPRTVILDPDGIVLFNERGVLSAADIEAHLP